MNTLFVNSLSSRRPSDVLSDALRTFAERKRKAMKKSVHFGMDVVLKQCVVDGDMGELELLVSRHGNGILNQLDSGDMPLAVRAVVEDRFDVLEFLLKKGVDLTLADPEGWTALHAAVACGDVRAAKYILRAGRKSNLFNYQTIHGLRPIDLAETVEMAHLLYKADINAFRKQLQRFTAEKPHERNPNNLAALCVSKDEASLVVALLSKTHQEAQKFLKQKAKAIGHNLLHVSAGKNFTKLALLLLDTHLLGIECRDQNGWTPLHTAAYYNSVDMILLLRECGSNIDARDLEGLTPDNMTDDPLVEDLLCDIVF